MMDAALERTDIAAGICSAATRGGFDQVVNSVVGTDRLERLDVVMAGDDVPRKKPDPIIYSEFRAWNFSPLFSFVFLLIFVVLGVGLG